MKAKIGLLALSILATSSAFAGGSLKNGVLIVPNNGNVEAVLRSLEDNGFQFSGNVQCAQSAKFVRIRPVSANSQTLKISCVSEFGSRTVAVPMNQINVGNAKGDPNEFEGTATGDPNEFEGNATGDPNEFEGTATGDPNEFEGNATGSKKASSPLVRFLGKIEKAARSVHATIYKLITE